MVYYDPRWRGTYGIGRFSSAVLKRIPGEPLQIAGHPASPLDPLRLSLALSSCPRDTVFFSPGFNAPFFSRSPFVFTVHDLNHIDRPENSSAAKRLYYSLILKRACRQAAHVLTVSDFSRTRIAEWSGLPLERVTNVGNGVDRAFNSGVEHYTPGYPYLFCVGNRKLHKNELRTIEAFSAANVPQQMRLIFSGNPTAELVAKIENAGMSGRIVFAGQIPESQLPSYYRGAVALLFPSLYEGFGLPVIEAMACGTPVITSNTTSLPEVAGDAALLVTPESVEEIASAIRKLLSDTGLQEHLRTRGYQQAAKFTWERTYAKTIEVLSSV
jgi:glycosyltransferase involved in cell wall biosynthesis